MFLKSFFIIFYLLMVFVQSEKGRRRDNGRQGRLFSFNTVDNDISVDLDFTIPFIKIPVKRTIESAYGLSNCWYCHGGGAPAPPPFSSESPPYSMDVLGSTPLTSSDSEGVFSELAQHSLWEFPTININPASLALGGVVVISAGILLPFLLKSYALQTDGRYSRILDNAEFGADTMFDIAQQMMSNGKGFRGCPLRVACWIGQRELADPQVIGNQIASNKLLSNMVNSSAVEDAIMSGRHGRDCMSYGPCPVQDQHIPILLEKLAVLTKLREFY